ncbi:glycosyltransferase family 2 protein [Candidatus Microgenomates bacterium]|nr:glycosyltransferase family 2 protein [Candidatus Microgenomates bacterium]
MISVIILTKNEEKNIEKCIKSVQFCDEAIVIDDNSEDKTVEMAKKSGAKVFSHSLDNDFAQQRNFGLEKAKGDWVLFVDADERISDNLKLEIGHLALDITPFNGFYLKRQDIMWGKEIKHGEQGNIKLLRLAKKNAGKWQRQVHEYWDICGKTGELKNPLQHYPHQSLTEFMNDVNFYSTLHAQQKFNDGEYSNLLHILLWPKLKFFKNWILRAGFLDGTAGFVLTVMMSWHSFFAWSKLWIMGRRPPFRAT